MGGTCVNKNHVTTIQNEKSSATLHDEVIKCSSGHFLALFETAKCTNCQAKHLNVFGKVSCIECQYALCEQCFLKKFKKWENKAQLINSKQADQLLKCLKRQFKEYIKFKKQHNNVQNFTRLLQFLEHQTKQHLNIRTNSVSLITSLQVRTEKVTSLCQRVYNNRISAAV